MKQKTPIDMIIDICAERDALGKVIEFYWARIQEFGVDNSAYELSRLHALQAQYREQAKRFSSFSVPDLTTQPPHPTEQATKL